MAQQMSSWVKGGTPTRARKPRGGRYANEAPPSASSCLGALGSCSGPRPSSPPGVRAFAPSLAFQKRDSSMRIGLAGHAASEQRGLLSEGGEGRVEAWRREEVRKESRVWGLFIAPEATSAV